MTIIFILHALLFVFKLAISQQSNYKKLKVNELIDLGNWNKNNEMNDGFEDFCKKQFANETIELLDKIDQALLEDIDI